MRIINKIDVLFELIHLFTCLLSRTTKRLGKANQHRNPQNSEKAIMYEIINTNLKKSNGMKKPQAVNCMIAVLDQI